jgi:hypothetical protein
LNGIFGSGQTEKGEKDEEESQELAHHLKSPLQAKQSIPHTTVTFYDNCFKMCEDFAPNFGDKGMILHHDNAPSTTSFFFY